MVALAILTGERCVATDAGQIVGQVLEQRLLQDALAFLPEIARAGRQLQVPDCSLVLSKAQASLCDEIF